MLVAISFNKYVLLALEFELVCTVIVLAASFQVEQQFAGEPVSTVKAYVKELHNGSVVVNAKGVITRAAELTW